VTTAAHSDLATSIDSPADPLREAVTSLEWVRRKLHTADSSHGPVLDKIIESVRSSPNGRDALVDPWTARWIAGAVRLIDRGALSLLPDGQTTAHFRQAVNLLAALVVGRATADIRFDRDGVAWLPGTGACVRGSNAIAGSAATLVATKPHEADRSDPPVKWPDIASIASVEGAEARICEAGALEPAADPADQTEASAPSEVSEATSTSSDARALVSRWPGRMRLDPLSPPKDFSPPRDLAALLAAEGIPVEIAPNTLASSSIRLDSSFDHLSLLSIRSPHDFDRIAQAATQASDRFTRRIQAHVAYIGRRYMDAAAIYAGLLAQSPGDTDLWRDVCWALRHAGHEELVLTWILHPAEVVQVAEEVDWQNDGLGGATSTGEPLDRLVQYLEWVGDAVRTR
jgi:hypothetical protein